MQITNTLYKFILLLLVFSFLSQLSLSQTTQSSNEVLRGIPPNLQPSLTQRINQFIEAQRNGEWETVSTLLGQYRGQPKPYFKFTEEHKKCLIEQIKSESMISFEPTGLSYSTDILNRPLSEKYWTVKGNAEFRTASGNIKKKSSITVYRNLNQWFITPPNYDGEWERKKVTQEDLSAEMNKFLEVVQQPDCPLEILDVSVRIHPEYLSLRRVSFKLRNKTKKTIKGYSYRMSGIFVGAGQIIKPEETLSFDDPHHTYSAYVFYCEGEKQRKFFIDSVDFSDGTEWKTNQKRKK